MKPQEIIDLLKECRELRGMALDAFFDCDIKERIERTRAIVRIHNRIDTTIKQLEQEPRE